MKRINHKSSAFLILISIIIASLMVFSFGCVKEEESGSIYIYIDSFIDGENRTWSDSMNRDNEVGY